MASGNDVAPVIVKRKKIVAGGGHHGGAWKVAYADFVTAMMAFFLLMWLLNATTEKQRKGIAEYFSPTVAINRVSGGGNGSFSGESVFAEKTLPKMGTGASHNQPTDLEQSRGASGTTEKGADDGTQDEKFVAVEQALMGRGGESAVMDNIMRHVTTRLTDEGYVIEIHEREGVRMFDDAGEPTDLLTEFAMFLADVVRLVDNDIAIEGHVPSAPIIATENPVWAASYQRADAYRKLLENSGLGSNRIVRVTGHADREPISSNPMSVRNNRLEFILLRSGY